MQRTNMSRVLVLAAVLVALACAENYGTVLATFYSDAVSCNASSYQGGQTVVSGKCNHMEHSQSGWPWIKWSCNAHVTTCIYSTSYTDSSCTAPAASHFNYCNECKANILRTCNGVGLNMSVTFWNCTDDTCGSCAPLVTIPVTGESDATCSANPLPGMVTGASIVVHRAMQCVALNHSWWTGENCGEGAGQFGSDLIVLNQCNNGWKFECLY